MHYARTCEYKRNLNFGWIENLKQCKTKLINYIFVRKYSAMFQEWGGGRIILIFGCNGELFKELSWELFIEVCSS